ncbi:uncharacterized protein LOC142917410 isoform X1 [Petromyzon marinus]|uniref:uncharacterized protein LOC142917410 isoform X1 n=1 Tax=Petromyzon marinus TaxID=7757 RepID=UPI003F6F1975
MAAMAASRSALLLPLLLPLLLLQVTAIAMSAVSWMEKVQGETVVLGCTWTGDPTDTEVLDVEWFLQMPTTNIYVATFAGGEGHIYPDFASRVRFARNATRRDASLQIAGLRASDAGVYTCKVKFGTFIKLETIRLTVLVKPSQPSCVVNGSLQQGEELSLQCLSTEGTSPIRYRWSKAGGEEGPSPSVLGGTLRISNASESHAETYRCNASNRVGWRSCVVTLSLVSPSANAGVVTGAVMGVLLLLVVVAAIGFLVLYPLLKRKAAWDRDYRHNDIRIDARDPRPARHRHLRRPPGTGAPRRPPGAPPGPGRVAPRASGGPRRGRGLLRREGGGERPVRASPFRRAAATSRLAPGSRRGGGGGGGGLVGRRARDPRSPIESAASGALRWRRVADPVNESDVSNEGGTTRQAVNVVAAANRRTVIRREREGEWVAVGVVAVPVRRAITISILSARSSQRRTCRAPLSPASPSTPTRDRSMVESAGRAGERVGRKVCSVSGGFRIRESNLKICRFLL